MTMLMDHGGYWLKYIWIFLVFPFVGSLLAVVFHDYVYKKTQGYVEEEYQERMSRREGMLGPKGN